MKGKPFLFIDFNASRILWGIAVVGVLLLYQGNETLFLSSSTIAEAADKNKQEEKKKDKKDASREKDRLQKKEASKKNDKQQKQEEKSKNNKKETFKKQEFPRTAVQKFQETKKSVVPENVPAEKLQPLIRILSPKNGDRVRGNKVAVRGRGIASLQFKAIFVNGRLVTNYDVKGKEKDPRFPGNFYFSFSVKDVPLQPDASGNAEIRAIATDGQNNVLAEHKIQVRVV